MSKPSNVCLCDVKIYLINVVYDGDWCILVQKFRLEAQNHPDGY